MKINKKYFTVVAILVCIILVLIFLLVINPPSGVYTNNIKLKSQSEISDYKGEEDLGYKYEEDGKYILYLENEPVGDRKIMLTKEQYDELKEGENYYFIIKYWQLSHTAKVYDINKRNMAR